jgi:hypothetical protein
MPTPQSPGTNKYRCDGCGRHFNTQGELAEHQRDCLTAQLSGRTEKPKLEDPREEGEDRDWVSTP